jgi:hypothetical protein
MSGSICTMVPMAICVLPAITSTIAGEPPLNGTCTMSTPLSILKYSNQRCWALPKLALAKMSFARVGLGIGDQIQHRLRRHRGMAGEHAGAGAGAQLGNGLEGFDGVIR